MPALFSTCPRVLRYALSGPPSHLVAGPWGGQRCWTVRLRPQLCSLLEVPSGLSLSLRLLVSEAQPGTALCKCSYSRYFTGMSVHRKSSHPILTAGFKDLCKTRLGCHSRSCCPRCPLPGAQGSLSPTPAGSQHPQTKDPPSGCRINRRLPPPFLHWRTESLLQGQHLEEWTNPPKSAELLHHPLVLGEQEVGRAP